MDWFGSDDVIPLITFDGQRYALNADAAALLADVKTPIALVSIAGRYRTGKSFLLNSLCQTTGSSFTVGDTTTACTKGLHIRKTPLQASPTLTTFAIDTEGISSLSANEDHDVKILSLALLLSSCFLYNSVGAIDDQALQSLNLMTKVSEYVRADVESRDAAPPRFFWCLRDFSLRLESADGVACDEAEYLEAALAQSQGGESDERNRVREAIKTTFPRRSLVTLVRPAGEHAAPRPQEGQPQVRRGRRRAAGRRAARAGPLRAGPHALTGTMLAQVCQCYVDALNKPGAVPTIRDSWSMLTSRSRRATRARPCTSRRPTSCASGPRKGVRVAVRAGRGAPARIAAYVEQFRATAGERGADLVPSFEEDLRALCDGLLRAEARRAFDARLEASLRGVEAALAAGDAEHLATYVSEELGRARADLCEAGLGAWKTACFDRLLGSWLPAALDSASKGREEQAARVAELEATCAELQTSAAAAQDFVQRETARLAREHEIHAASLTASLQMQLDAKTEDYASEVGKKEELERELDAMRVEVAVLRDKAAAAEERARAELAEAAEEEERRSSTTTDEDEEASFEDRKRVLQLEEEARGLRDENREITAIRDSLLMQLTKERDAKDKLETAFVQRLGALLSMQNDSVQRLRKEGEEAAAHARAQLAAAEDRETTPRATVAQMQVSARGRRARARAVAPPRGARHARVADDAGRDDGGPAGAHARGAPQHPPRRATARRSTASGSRPSRPSAAQVERAERSGARRRRPRSCATSSASWPSGDELQRELKRARDDARDTSVRRDQMTLELEKLRGRLDECLAERERLRAAPSPRPGRRRRSSESSSCSAWSGRWSKKYRVLRTL